MANSIKKVVLLVNGLPRAMCKQFEQEFYEKMFKSDGVVQGTYKKGRPEGMQRGVEGIFTSNEGDQYIIYSDWSANHKEHTDEKGYPTAEFLKMKSN